MGWRLRPKPKRVPGEYPDRFVKGWMATTLPTTVPAEAASAVAHLQSKGWTEQQVAEFILPYMPREAVPPVSSAARGAPTARGRGAAAVVWASDGSPVAPSAGESPVAARPAGPASALPPDVTHAWLDEHLPQMDGRQLRFVVDELERRGWPPGTVAMAVLPHLLPTLPAADRRAVIAGLAHLGMTGVEITRATRPR